jgi:hypothetical protein
MKMISPPAVIIFITPNPKNHSSDYGAGFGCAISGR